MGQGSSPMQGLCSPPALLWMFWGRNQPPQCRAPPRPSLVPLPALPEPPSFRHWKTSFPSSFRLCWLHTSKTCFPPCRQKQLFNRL